MRKYYIVFIFLFTINSFGQELNLGIQFGVFPLRDNTTILHYGTTVEYKPEKSIISINSDQMFHFYESKMHFSIPVYIKFSFGNKIPISFNAGGFIRTDLNYGWLIGTGLEYCISENIALFSKIEMYKDYWKEDRSSPGGAEYTITHNIISYFFTIGIRKNIL